MHMILGTCVKENLLVAKEYTCSTAGGFPATTLYSIESEVHETIQLMLEYEYMFITNFCV